MSRVMILDNIIYIYRCIEWMDLDLLNSLTRFCSMYHISIGDIHYKNTAEAPLKSSYLPVST